MKDGYQFRIDAKGSEQKVRGLKWRNKRPDLIVCDDLENDEIVMNKDRREKFRGWFHKALLPCRAKGGKIVVVGTVLHMDSQLERLLNDPDWYTVRYAAHNEDFSAILWPERYTQEDFEVIRNGYIRMGMPEGYSQEYLNYPIDESTAYFRREDFKYYNKEELDYSRLTFYSAVDFAISQKEKSDYTVILTVGIDSSNRMYVVDVERGRWDAKEIIDNMLETQRTWEPVIMTVEEGHIRKALGPFLKEEMLRSGTIINLLEMVPSKDKETRARSIQARLKQGTVYFNGKAHWYADLEQEMIRFPKDVHDDQVDALAWIGLTLSQMSVGRTKEEYEEDRYNETFEDELSDRTNLGANRYTGY
jgi:predicted phage terminase large subunit-like protein